MCFVCFYGVVGLDCFWGLGVSECFSAIKLFGMCQ